MEEVRALTEVKKEPMISPRESDMDGRTQEEVDSKMKDLVKEFPKLFTGHGEITGVDPVPIDVDKSVKPVQQKRRPIRYTMSTK